MTLILTNDDGVDAPGIQALQKAISGQTVVIAPQTQFSGCGHQVTTSLPIQVQQRSPTVYGVAGTPADCVRLGIQKFCPNPEWVVSGINAGGNLGVDVYISGTVAAVREAAIHGIPGIAISQWIKKSLPIDWERATGWTKDILIELWSRPLDPKSFWNVNLPYLEPNAPDPDLVFCELSIQPLPMDYRVEGDLYYYQGEYDQRERTPGTDVDICFSGNIAVTQIHL